ncbi:MAG: NADH-quinone oxidoreductase subunit [Pseudonocardiales bacterium]|nr:NADH-quinone oxidoreductase subunit [Pseudonocardiales bacterium]
MSTPPADTPERRPGTPVHTARGISTNEGPSTESVSGEATLAEIANASATAELGKFGNEQHGMFGVRDGGDTSGFGGLVREPFVTPAAERPYGSYFDEVVDSLIAASAKAAAAVEKVVVDRGELTLYIRADAVDLVARTLRDDPSLRFELLSSVHGVDLLGNAKRLHAIYEMRSMTYRRRIRLEVAVTEDDPHIPSLTALYPTADWQERETYDMFGIVFDGHPALTRILMPDDWVGHPQRKDYPLGGVPVEYKGATIPPPDERRAYR